MGKVLWEYYTEAAAKNGKHYNVIEILWGSGNLKRHVWAGIKLARVVNSFVMKYGLNIEDIHGIGFRYMLYNEKSYKHNALHNYSN